jgi:hypothetical protein
MGPRQPDRDPRGNQPDPGAIALVEGTGRVQAGHEDAEALRSERFHEPQDRRFRGRIGTLFRGGDRRVGGEANQDRLVLHEGVGEAPRVAGLHGDALGQSGAATRTRSHGEQGARVLALEQIDREERQIVRVRAQGTLKEGGRLRETTGFADAGRECLQQREPTLSDRSSLA